MAFRCYNCERFRPLNWDGEFDQVILELDAYNHVTAEYEATLNCEECGEDMASGTFTFEQPDDTPGLEEYSEGRIELAREKAKEDFITSKMAEGWPREQIEAENADKIEELMDDAELSTLDSSPYEFELKEESVNVCKDKFCGRQIWTMELEVWITDTKNPEWEGLKVTLKEDLYNEDLEAFN